MTTHPTDEQLATFLEGRLSGDDRRALIAHLDACPRCLEWVAEIGATLAESTDADGRAAPTEATIAAPPLAAGSRSHGVWWTLVAAMIALAAGVIFWPRPVVVDRLADALHGSADDLSALTTRGAETGLAGFAGRPRPAAAVLAGATELELTLARRAGDDLDLHCIPLEALVDQALRCGNPRAVASTLERVFGFEDLEIGRWLAAARLAALTRDASFFVAVEIPALEQVGGLARVPLERAELLRALGRLSDRPTATDFDAVARSVDELLAAL